MNLEIEQCWIAGGAVTSYATDTPVNDYDVYPKNREGLQSALEYGFSMGQLVHLSDRAATFLLHKKGKSGKRIPYQVITFDFFETTEALFNTFDFTACMGAWCCDNHKYIFHDSFLLHNSQRQLYYNESSPYPLSSLLRVRKYEQRGYEMKSHQRLKLALNIKHPTSWSELKEQIGGVYGETIQVDETLEFNHINLMKVLDDAKLVTLEPDVDKYRAYTTEVLMCVLNATPRWYHTVGRHTLVWTEHEMSTLYDVPYLPEHWSEANPSEWTVRTHKRVNDDLSSSYRPSFRYIEGDTVVETKSPWLYAGKGYYNGDTVVTVETPLSAVKQLNQSYIQTSELYVVTGSARPYSEGIDFGLELVQRAS